MEVKKQVRDILNAEPAAFNENMPDYSKDPTFIKKREEAIKFLKKADLPKWLKKKK